MAFGPGGARRGNDFFSIFSSFLIPILKLSDKRALWAGFIWLQLLHVMMDNAQTLRMRSSIDDLCVLLLRRSNLQAVGAQLL